MAVYTYYGDDDPVAGISVTDDDWSEIRNLNGAFENAVSEQCHGARFNILLYMNSESQVSDLGLGTSERAECFCCCF